MNQGGQGRPLSPAGFEQRLEVSKGMLTGSSASQTG